jgi:hypothetical protein
LARVILYAMNRTTHRLLWTLEQREFTIWCELEIDTTLIWLEWNERGFAYRCGISKHGLAGRSHLGFADSLEDAQQIALDLLSS